MHKISVGILGGSGYAGRELCTLVARHPALDLVFAAAQAQQGGHARIGGRDIIFVATEEAPLERASLVFSALPHGASAPWVARARSAGAKVVDLSADLRPGSGAEQFAPYGLTELTRDQVRDADVVANPGCYATAVLLALAPLLERGLIAEQATVTINAASGVTGAGFTPKPELLYAEVAEDFRPYGVGNVHRHLAEMRALLDRYRSSAELIFTPHLLPLSRGILATLVVPLASRLSDPLAPWREQYRDERFIEVIEEPPRLRDVVHRNVARITAVPVAGTRRPQLLVMAAIDNLVKGAAGQALQNANLQLGLDETLGLPA